VTVFCLRRSVSRLFVLYCIVLLHIHTCYELYAIDNVAVIHQRLAEGTMASSVARSLKLRHVDHGNSTWMDDHQERLGDVNLGLFIGVDLIM